MSAHDFDYDLIVIGCGPAGERGAAQAAYFGHRVLVVEKEPEPGGAAVHTGTLPSKTLRETALYLSGFRQRELYGVSVALENPHAAVPRLIARKDAIASQESTRIRENLKKHGVELAPGKARFTGPHEIAIDGPTPRRATGKFFLIDPIRDLLPYRGPAKRRPPTSTARRGAGDHRGVHPLAGGRRCAEGRNGRGPGERWRK